MVPGFSRDQLFDELLPMATLSTLGTITLANKAAHSFE